MDRAKSYVGSILMLGNTYNRSFVGRVLGPYGENRFDLAPFTTSSNSTLELLDNANERKWIQDVLDQVNSYLLGEGWQPLPRGSYWFSYRYRRPYDEVEDALQLLDYMRSSGARLKPSYDFQDIRIEGVQFRADTQARFDRLTPRLLALLRDEYGISDSDSESAWETCTIYCLQLKYGGKSTVAFQAEAVGPRGDSIAGSVEFKTAHQHYRYDSVPYYLEAFSPTNKDAKHAHAKLVKELTDAGWEPMPDRWESISPMRWFATNFRRRVT